MRRSIRHRLAVAVATAAVLLPVGAAASPAFASGPTASAPATAAYHHGTYGRVVTGGSPLNVRSGPSTRYRVLSRVHNGTVLRLSCQRQGSTVRGNGRWYRLADRRGWVSASYVRTYRHVPWC